jgi:hypothetical protein
LFHAQQVAEQAIKAVLVIPLLVLLALLSGCALLDRATDLSSRAFAEMSGGDTTRVGDPLYLHLQLALLSDKVVTQILQKTEMGLAAVDEPNRRAAVLAIRLDYAAAMWNAASGPSPYANAINMLLTLTVGRRQLERSPLAHALGESLRPTLAVLRSAQGDVESLVRGFLTPAEFSALNQAIQEADESHVAGQRLAIVDLQQTLRHRESRRAAVEELPRTFSASSVWIPLPGSTPRRARSPRAGSSASGCCSICSACRSCCA